MDKTNNLHLFALRFAATKIERGRRRSGANVVPLLVDRPAGAILRRRAAEQVTVTASVVTISNVIVPAACML